MAPNPQPRTRPGAVLAILVAAAAAAGAAAYLTLITEPRAAGIAVAVAGAALILGDLRSREGGQPRLLFASSVAERVVDGTVFGALAWALMPAEPRAGAAALAALSAAYVATYIRAKATGLGFDVEEPRFLQPLRMGAVATGLLTGAVEPGLWAATAVGVGGVVARTVEVAMRRETA